MPNARKDCSWIARIRLGALVSIVALGVLLIPTLIAGRPGQAPQTGPTYRVLHRFTGGTDGAVPGAGVILDPTRKLLVGTTAAGGDYGAGTVFGLSPFSGQETVLYTFTGGADGSEPWAGLIRDALGNLYGTTYHGGAYGNGVAFELSPTGQETVLCAFTWGDGGEPWGDLIRDSAGNLYGTTFEGDAYGAGVVFQLSLTGHETVLHSFTGGADGGWPLAGLIGDATGNLYGTTQSGGAYDLGWSSS